MKKKTILLLILILVGIGIGFGISKILNSKEKTENDIKYVIVTDYKYMTMRNDGGSHTSVYYEITNNTVKKLEDEYVGFKGYEYQGKVIYEKEIDVELKKEFISLLEELIEKEDVNATNNYSPFVINFDDKEKTIYNETSIESLKTIIEKVDNL